MKHRHVQLLQGAYLVSQVNVLRILYPVRRGAIPLQWTTDHRTVRRVVDGWSPEERARYRHHLTPDTLHPFIYCAAWIAQERELRGRRQPRLGRAFTAVILTVGACDLVENLHHARFVRGDITPSAVRRSGWASRTKWAVALPSWIRLVQLAATKRG